MFGWLDLCNWKRYAARISQMQYPSLYHFVIIDLILWGFTSGSSTLEAGEQVNSIVIK